MKKREDKLSGSYYTPYRTVQFMKEYLAREHKIYRRVLEPSVGDGRFVDAFEKEENIQSVVAVELIEEKVRQLKNKSYSEQVEIVADDFLDFSEKSNEKYQLIIGNPPYINIKNMEDNSKEKAKEICEKYQLPSSLMQNMWVAFVLAAVSCLERGGTIFFVLPMEFLQVQYAEKIRLFLEEHFDTIHILTFRERMFPEIEQESCLVYLTNEFKNQPYIYFKMYTKLDSDIPYYCSKIERNKPLKKWTNAILSDTDIDLLNLIDSKYKKVSEVCDASPGIVTGANNEFILTKEQVKQLGCQKFILPTISKSNMLNGQLVLTQDAVRKIGEKGNRIYLLDLSHVDEEFFPVSLKEYLTEIGEKENASKIKLKNRYKCRKRRPWYGVPIVRNGDLFFFKRYDRIPRVCVNEADIYTTDIAYNMRLNPAYDKESMAFCFYNSLTLTQCEFYGRYYAGGVSELTPSEFKRLAIPYRKISKDDIERLTEMFMKNEDMDQIIAFVNSKTIGKEWEDKQLLRLDEMRRKLMERRLM
ncbi:MAG: Eco57I restriction-modification methylase domain-containing protein [Lachnospiraceae bacterium]|nr:Eco57I restriction-modification methylase domain-containing protein [Lachnospiraceae bacterium]